MNNNDQIEYDKAFSRRFKNFLWIINRFALIATPIAAIALILKQQTAPEEWTETGRWATGVAITPFVALTVAYVWMRSMVKSWPRGRKEPVVLAFVGSGVYLMFGTVVLTLNPITESGSRADHWDAFGLVLPLGSIAFQFIGLLIILQAWDAQRKMIQRRGAK